MTTDTIVTADKVVQTSTTDAAADKTAAAADTTSVSATTTATDTGADKTGDKSAATTIVAAATDKTVTAPAHFPDNWRDTVADGVKPGDTALRKRLDRFTSPVELARSYLALEQKLSSGEYKAQLPKDAKPEQIEAWRKENGLPDKPEGYVAGLTLPQGMVLGEADKPVVSEFAVAALEGNVSPAQFSGLVAKYYKMQDAIALKQEEDDGAYWGQTEDALRAEWGGQYRANQTAVNNLVGRMPESVAKHLQGARIPAPTEKEPGRTVKLLGHPDFLRFMAQWESEINPAATLVPSGGGDAAKTLEGELATIRKRAQDDPDGYDRDKAMQARRFEITKALEKMKTRAA